jgi:hypothetical protein
MAVELLLFKPERWPFNQDDFIAPNPIVKNSGREQLEEKRH